jgi:hypothetical protein
MRRFRRLSVMLYSLYIIQLAGLTGRTIQAGWELLELNVVLLSPSSLSLQENNCAALMFNSVNQLIKLITPAGTYSTLQK